MTKYRTIIKLEGDAESEEQLREIIANAGQSLNENWLGLHRAEIVSIKQGEKPNNRLGRIALTLAGAAFIPLVFGPWPMFPITTLLLFSAGMLLHWLSDALCYEAPANN